MPNIDDFFRDFDQRRREDEQSLKDEEARFAAATKLAGERLVSVGSMLHDYKLALQKRGIQSQDGHSDKKRYLYITYKSGRKVTLNFEILDDKIISYIEPNPMNKDFDFNLTEDYWSDVGFNHIIQKFIDYVYECRLGEQGF